MSVTAINILAVLTVLIFGVLLVALFADSLGKIFNFNVWQRLNHAIHGRPAYLDASDPQQGVRQMITTTPASKFKIKPTPEFPRTYAVFMDWPMKEDIVATVTSVCDGNASVYAKGKPIAIGGIYHESVRQAVTDFIRTADNFFKDSVATTDFPYPEKDKVRFYLATFDGVRTIETDLKSVEEKHGHYFTLFEAGQKVLTQLRLTEVRLAPKKEN